jgi:RimJ/RimL family protein N-acetyltransferase
VNTEAKLLQFTFAFETLKLVRVALKTHASNQRSQAAIKAVGGIYEGTFRNHYIMPDGSTRDSAWFSIIAKEWPEVKDLLTRRMNAPI